MLESLINCLAGLCPESCPRCSRKAEGGFCSDCRRDFLRIRDPCPGCAMPRPCRDCPARMPGWHLSRIFAPFAYAPPLSRYVRALKYQRQPWLGRSLGDLLATEIGFETSRVDGLVAVPLHPRRLRWRTFNQADEIAQRIAARSGLRLHVRGIRRCRNTRPQTERDRRERVRLDQETFAIGRGLEGLSLTLIDDVATTGATLNALAGALKQAGAIRVEAWVLARAMGELGSQPLLKR